jgi:hypothetical protein
MLPNASWRPSAERQNRMRKTIVSLSVIIAAALLGGCAGNMSGGTLLPGTGQFSAHRLDVTGGGPVPSPDRLHRLDVTGGGPVPGPHKVRHLDVTGGGPVPAPGGIRHLDVTGGGPVPAPGLFNRLDVTGGGPVPYDGSGN